MTVVTTYHEKSYEELLNNANHRSSHGDFIEVNIIDDVELELLFELIQAGIRSNGLKIKKHGTTTKLRQESFFRRVPDIWNVVGASSFTSFKK